MYHVFNMGVGMVIVLPPSQIDTAIASLRELGESPSLIGEIIHGEKCVRII
jgi:phosphoribosylformylglycinamidine cyclo-ligase